MIGASTVLLLGAGAVSYAVLRRRSPLRNGIAAGGQGVVCGTTTGVPVTGSLISNNSASIASRTTITGSLPTATAYYGATAPTVTGSLNTAPLASSGTTLSGNAPSSFAAPMTGDFFNKTALGTGVAAPIGAGILRNKLFNRPKSAALGTPALAGSNINGTGFGKKFINVLFGRPAVAAPAAVAPVPVQKPGIVKRLLSRVPIIGKLVPKPKPVQKKKSKLRFLLIIILPLAAVGGLVSLKRRLSKKPVVLRKRAPIAGPAPVPAPIPVAQPLVAKKRFLPLLRVRKVKKVIPAEEVVEVDTVQPVIRQPPPVRYSVKTQYAAPPQHAEIIEEAPLRSKRYGRRL
jgi:hypothetical protein